MSIGIEGGPERNIRPDSANEYAPSQATPLDEARDRYVAELLRAPFGIKALGGTALREARNQYGEQAQTSLQGLPRQFQREEHLRFTDSLESASISEDTRYEDLLKLPPLEDPYEFDRGTVGDKIKMLPKRLVYRGDNTQARIRNTGRRISNKLRYFGKEKSWEYWYKKNWQTKTEDFEHIKAWEKARKGSGADRIAPLVRSKKFRFAAGSLALAGAVVATAISSPHTENIKPEPPSKPEGYPENVMKPKTDGVKSDIAGSVKMFEKSANIKRAKERRAIRLNEERSQKWQPVTNAPDGFWAERNEKESAYKIYANSEYNSVWQIAEQTAEQHLGHKLELSGTVHLVHKIVENLVAQDRKTKLFKGSKVMIEESWIDEAAAVSKAT